MVREEGGEDGHAGQGEMGVSPERIQLGHRRLYERHHLQRETLEPTEPVAEDFALVKPLLEAVEGEELDEDSQGACDGVRVSFWLEEEKDPVQPQHLTQGGCKPGHTVCMGITNALLYQTYSLYTHHKSVHTDLGTYVGRQTLRKVLLVHNTLKYVSAPTAAAV